MPTRIRYAPWGGEGTLVTSRNAELAAAFNRLRQIRSRRVERLLAGHTRTPIAPSDDEPTATPEGPAT